MADIYDLEEKIQACWSVCEDIKLTWTEFSDGLTPMSEDELCNILLGIETLYMRKFQVLFDTYEKVLADLTPAVGPCASVDRKKLLYMRAEYIARTTYGVGLSELGYETIKEVWIDARKDHLWTDLEDSIEQNEIDPFKEPGVHNE